MKKLKEYKEEIKMKSSLKSKLLLASVALVWGSSYMLSKLAFNYTGALTMIAYRFLSATILTSIFFYKKLSEINLKIIKKGFFMGSFLFLAMVLSTYGVKYTTASNAGFLSCLNVIIVPVIYFLFFKKKLKKKEIFGTIISFVGVCLLTITEQLTIGFGDILCILAALMFVMFIILGDKYSKEEDPLLIGLTQLGVVGILSMILAYFVEGLKFVNDIKGISIILILGLFCTAYCYIAQLYSQKNLNAVEAGLILSLEPLFSVVFSFLFLGEILLMRGYVGGALIVIGVIIGGVL